MKWRIIEEIWKFITDFMIAFGIWQIAGEQLKA